MIYSEEEIRISILDHLSLLWSERISHSSERCNSKTVHQGDQSGVSPLSTSHLTNACMMWWQLIGAGQLLIYGAATHENILPKFVVCLRLLLIT